MDYPHFQFAKCLELMTTNPEATRTWKQTTYENQKVVRTTHIKRTCFAARPERTVQIAFKMNLLPQNCNFVSHQAYVSRVWSGSCPTFGILPDR